MDKALGDGVAHQSGNIVNTSNPEFVNAPATLPASPNFGLTARSPAINAGTTLGATSTDFDSATRPQGSGYDIGAYEYQGSGSRISYAWLQQYGLPTDGSADYCDADADSMNNWQEWVCGTCPTNTLSALHLLTPTLGGTNVTVSWQSVAGVNYFLERSTNLAAASPQFTPLATKIPGQLGATTYTDADAVGAGPFFYRVRVVE